MWSAAWGCFFVIVLNFANSVYIGMIICWLNVLPMKKQNQYKMPLNIKYLFKHSCLI